MPPHIGTLTPFPVITNRRTQLMHSWGGLHSRLPTSAMPTPSPAVYYRYIQFYISTGRGPSHGFLPWNPYAVSGQLPADPGATPPRSAPRHSSLRRQRPRRQQQSPKCAPRWCILRNKPLLRLHPSAKPTLPRSPTCASSWCISREFAPAIRPYLGKPTSPLVDSYHRTQ